MRPIIRDTRPEDARDMEQFAVLMDFLSERAKDPERQRALLAAINANPDQRLLVLEDADTGTLCGSLIGILFPDPCADCGAICVIENVVTHPDYRRQGVARQLFDAIEAWAKARGAHYAILCSGLHRTDAHLFYAALGYQDMKGFKKYL